MGPSDPEVSVYVCDMEHPRDLSNLAAVFDAGVSAESVVAVIGKTLGGGLHEDFGRELTELSLLDLLSTRMGVSSEDVAERVPIILSGGAVGVITPHLTVITRTAREALHEGTDNAGGRLSVGTALSDEILPEELGRVGQIEKVASAVKAAVADAGGLDRSEIHCVLVKAPSLTRKKIAEARARGRDVVTEELLPGERGAGEYANDASCLGVAVALGEVSPSAVTDAIVRQRWDLHSELAHASAGGEKSRAEVCVLGNSPAASGTLRIGHSVAETLVDSEGIKDALRSAGLAFDCCPSVEQLDRVVQVFAHPVIPDNGLLFGHQTTLWGDSEATKTTKALVGGIVAGLLKKTSIYVSGGEHNSHQGPPGGYPVATIVRAEPSN